MHAELPLLPFYLLESLAIVSLVIFGAVVGLAEEVPEYSRKRQSVIPLNHKAGKTRDGGYTCFNGNVCMVTTAGMNWVDDMTQEDIAPSATCYYCYRCDFCVEKK